MVSGEIISRFSCNFQKSRNFHCASG